MKKDFYNSFVSPKDVVTFNQEYQPAELYKRFSEKILFRMKVSPNNSYGLTPPNGLLVYGPPCNGKSTLVRQFAKMADLPFLVVNRYDLIENGGHHTSKLFETLMSAATSLAPCVVILEDVETVIPDRKKILGSVEYLDVMSNLSLLRNCGNNGVFVFATTSKPQDVDMQLGMSGYLNELFYTPFPDIKQREFILRSMIGKRPCMEEIDYNYIAKECENYLIGDLISLVEEITLNAAIHDAAISNNMVQKTFETFRYPLSSMMKKEYDEIHSALEAKNKRQQNRIIGFK